MSSESVHESAVDPVAEKIERLVDILRADRERPLNMAEIASITEVLLLALKRHCRSVDNSIYGEFRVLAELIHKTRMEVSELRPEELRDEKIPRAGRELEAIVESTEEATGTIMDAAEEIMAGDTSDLDAYQGMVTDACMRIFEACSFQDITGQRINKVVRTLTLIETRLGRIQLSLGGELDINEVDNIDPLETREDADLLRGPALAGEGIDQDSIDSLLGDIVEDQRSDDAEAGSPAAEVPVEAATPATEADASDEAEKAEDIPTPDLQASAPTAEAVEAAEAPKAEAAAAEAPAKAKPVAEAKPAPVKVADDADDAADDDDDDTLMAASSQKASQSEIDALFD